MKNSSEDIMKSIVDDLPTDMSLLCCNKTREVFHQVQKNLEAIFDFNEMTPLDGTYRKND